MPQWSGRRLTKLVEKGVLVIGDTKNADFMGHKYIWQNFQDKEETDKACSTTRWN